MTTCRSILLGMLAISLLSVSCKRKKSETFEALLGTWKIHKTAIDKNNNGQMDADEITVWRSPVPTNSFYFNRDRNGMYFAIYKDTAGRVVSNNCAFQFSINDKELEISKTNGSSILSDGKHNIDVITDMELTFKESVGGATNWTVYNRQ